MDILYICMYVYIYIHIWNKIYDLVGGDWNMIFAIFSIQLCISFHLTDVHWFGT